MAYACRIVADSFSPSLVRLTTFEVTYPRFVHSELMTHRMFSRNSSSSRAIPIEKMIKQVQDDPAGPVWWGKNQAGMQALEELTGIQLANGRRLWLEARDAAVESAYRMMDRESCGAHKQIVNRLLEPWMWITVLVTATEWVNFFNLRCHPAAQPEIRKIAEMMKHEYNKTTSMKQSMVHLPFYDEGRDMDIETGLLRMVCVARCARVSYLTHEGQRDWQKDAELARTLAGNGHWSPFEHVADALKDPRQRSGNFIGWKQYREEVDPNFIK